MSKSSEKLQQYFKLQKGKTHKIENHPIALEEEHIRDFYLTMLCVASQAEGGLSEGQALFIQRIISGVENAKELREYVKLSLNIDDKFAEEFVTLFVKNDLKYNLIVDCLLIAHALEGEENKNIFLAEMIDTLGVKKEEALALAVIAIGILTQDSESYLSGIKSLSKKFDYTKFWYYGKEFVVGCVQNDSEAIYHYSMTQKEYIFPQKEGEKNNSIVLKSKKIVLQNLVLDLSQINRLILKSTESIYLINCEFDGKDKHQKGGISFYNSINIYVINCRFKNFITSRSVLLFSNICNVHIRNSIFTDCESTYLGYDTSQYGDMHCGSILYSEHCDCNVDIVESEFYRCQGNKYAIMSYRKKSINYKIEGCKFYECGNSLNPFVMFKESRKSDFIACSTQGCGRSLWYYN